MEKKVFPRRSANLTCVLQGVPLTPWLEAQKWWKRPYKHLGDLKSCESQLSKKVRHDPLGDFLAEVISQNVGKVRFFFRTEKSAIFRNLKILFSKIFFYSKTPLVKKIC